MTTPRTLTSYASPKKNGRVLADPRTSITQTEWNRLAKDVADLTNCPTKMVVQFATTTSMGAITPSAFAAQWCSGASAQPAVARTSTAGIYTVSTPSSWVTPGVWVYSLDPDGIITTTEAIAFWDSSGDIDGPITSGAAGFVRTSRSGYTVTVYVYSSSWTLSDLGGGVAIRVEAR